MEDIKLNHAKNDSLNWQMMRDLLTKSLEKTLLFYRPNMVLKNLLG